MRIAVNTRLLLGGKLEGIGWYTCEIVRRLVLSHPNDTFILFFDRAWDSSFVFGPNVECVRVFPPARHPLLFWIWFELRLPVLLKRYQADVFWSPDGFLSIGTSVPTVLTVHDLAYKHFPRHVSLSQRMYYRYFMPKFLRRADHVLAVSEATGADLRDSGVPADKLTVVYNGVGSGFVPASERECQQLRDAETRGQPFFLYVGALHPRKNILRLIRSFEAFKSDTGYPHHLVLLGRMAWKSGEIKSRLHQSPWKAYIHHVGYQSGQLPLWYSASAALVYVSLFEGFGIPIAEAMSCDTAVITSGLSAMPEVAGSAALLVDPYSEKEITTAMRRLVSESGLREKLIDKGREQRKKFRWEASAEMVWKVLCEVSLDTGKNRNKQHGQRGISI